MLKTVAVSANAKTGPIAVTYRSGQHDVFATCPSSCSLHPKANAKSIDKEYLKAVYNAVPKKGIAFAYSHFPAKSLPKPKPGKTTINASCDTIEDALKAVRRGNPTVYAAPVGTEWPQTHSGVRFIQCPAELSDKFTCRDCGGGTPLCSKPRDFVVVFVAHGTQKKLVGTGEGGCYGANGNVAIQWRNTMKSGNPDDCTAIKRFAQNLPVGTILRHHIVGDFGCETP